jgi:hypothetical protein
MSNPVSRYLDNLFNAGVKLTDTSGQVSAFGPRRTDNLKEQADARGQAWGAILQNRTYDEQGRIKGTQPGHHVTDSKNHTKKVKGD